MKKAGRSLGAGTFGELSGENIGKIIIHVDGHRLKLHELWVNEHEHRH